MTIQAAALRRYEENGSGALYVVAGNEIEEPVDIRLVPYYAWNNRGIGEMTVWLPRRF